MRRISSIIFAVAIFSFVSCESSKNVQAIKIEEPAMKLIEQNPPVRPSWADSIPQSKDTLYFVGLSNGFSTEKEARSDAYQNVLNQVVKYYGELIKNTTNEKKGVKALSSDVINPYIEKEELIQHYAEAYVHEILPENYYTEHWASSEKDEWKCFVKCSVSREKIQKEIETFADNISERYSALLPENQKGKYSSTKSAIQAYLDVYNAVHKNPIYQAVAYVQTSSGKASLDDYALLQAKRIIDNIFIKNIDYTKKVEQGNQFNATIHLDSADYERITGMGAIISLNHNGKEIVSSPFLINDKSDIELQINTEKLKYGNYLVLIQLYTDAFKELGTVYTSSTSITFSLNSIQAPVRIEYIKENSHLSELNNEITTRIGNILQEKLNENELPIEIASESDSDSEFVIQIKSTELKAAENVQKVKLNAAILFQKNDVTLAKSQDFTAMGLSKANMATESAFEQILDALKEDESFYKNLLKTVGERRK